MKSTIKVFRALETLCMSDAMGVSELANQLEIKNSSMHRFLSLLRKLGYVEKERNTGKYCATLKVFELGVIVRNKRFSLSLVQPYMEEIGRQFHETVNLALLIENKAVVIDSVESSEILRADHGKGTNLPAYCTALGKVLLAYQPDEELEKYVREQEFKAFAKKTITSVDEFKRKLIRVKKERFAMDDREFNDDIRCLAAPVRDASGRVIAAISISGPSMRLTLKRLKLIKQSFIDLTAEVSHKLGYREA